MKRVSGYTGALLLLLPAMLLAQAAQPAPSDGDATPRAPHEAKRIDIVADHGAYPLSDQRWAEHGYGVSVAIPAGANVNPLPDAEAMVRFAHPQHPYAIRLQNQSLEQPLNVESAKAAAVYQLQLIQPDARLIWSDDDVSISDQPGVLIHVQFPQPRGEPLFIAQAIVQLAPIELRRIPDAPTVSKAYFILEVRGPWSTASQLRGLFENMLESLKIPDQLERAMARSKKIKYSQAVRDKRWSDPQQHHAQLIGLQLFRIIEDGRDIGYVRMIQRQGARNELPGIEVVLNTHLIRTQPRMNSQLYAFLSDDRNYEMFQWRSTIIAPNAVGEMSTMTSKVEAMRSNDLLTIQFSDTMGGKDETQFSVPPVGYLSQVEAMMLPQLLPDATGGSFGFYWYDPLLRRLVYREDRVEPMLLGSEMISRPSPAAQMQRIVRDERGRVTEHQLSPQRKLVRTSQAELRALWPELADD